MRERERQRKRENLKLAEETRLYLYLTSRLFGISLLVRSTVYLERKRKCFVEHAKVINESVG